MFSRRLIALLTCLLAAVPAVHSNGVPIHRTPHCFGPSNTPNYYDIWSIQRACDDYCGRFSAPGENARCDRHYGDPNYQYCCASYEFLSHGLWNQRTPRCFGANSATTDQRLYSTQPWYGTPGDPSIAARCEEFCSQFQWPPPTEPTCSTRYGNQVYPYCCATYGYLSHTGSLIHIWDAKKYLESFITYKRR